MDAVDSVHPSEVDLCSLVMGQSSYEEVIEFLGAPDAELPGSFVSYSYGPGATVEEGRRLLKLSFDPEEIFESADAINDDIPGCWERGESYLAYQRRLLPSLSRAPTPAHQVPSDYPVLPPEEVLCAVELGRTTYDHVWFDVFDVSPVHIGMAGLEAAMRYRFSDPRNDAIVSLYFFFSAADWRDAPRVGHVVAYNATALPSCWGE